MQCEPGAAGHPWILPSGLWISSFWVEPALAESNFDVIAQSWDTGRKFWPVPNAKWGVRVFCQLNWLNLRGRGITFAAGVFSLLSAPMHKRRRGKQATVPCCGPPGVAKQQVPGKPLSSHSSQSLKKTSLSIANFRGRASLVTGVMRDDIAFCASGH